MSMSDINWRVSLAELIGVFLFVFIGAGTVMVTGAMTGGDMTMARLLVIALAHGLTIAILVAAIGHISGGHINPAVTFAAMLTKRVSMMQGVATILAQLVGAVLAAFALGSLFSTGSSGGGIGEGAGSLGAHALGPGVDAIEGVLMEILLTVLLVLVIFGAAMDKRGAGAIAPLAIGFAVAVDHLLGVGITGASMNPARSFGPALIAGAWDNHWVYWVGPLVGAAIAGYGYRYVFQGNKND